MLIRKCQRDVEFHAAFGQSPGLAWRRLGEHDFPLLRRWLEQPHVARWWNHETSPEALRRDFGPTMRGEDPDNEDLIALLDGQPFGLLQRCRIAGYPAYFADIAAVVELPETAMSLDYLIGEPHLIGHGLGTRMLRAAVEATWREHPAAAAIVIPVTPNNIASWRALEKAGFRRVGVGEIQPDNPVDSHVHFFYRTDRSTGDPAPNR
jgi:aminoglycoside 6'-N-acetyltransferase